MSEMEPPDPKRCQAEITEYRPFVMGGPVHQTRRCENVPAFLAVENQPGNDGRTGAMTICRECLAVFQKEMPADYATLVRIDEMKMPRAGLLPVTEAESSAIMAESDPERPYVAAFGAGGTALLWEKCRWALPVLSRLRGIEAKG